MTNFWDHHGLFFLLFITVFPRLTLIFSNVATGGILWWLGFIFAPRLLVALLATLTYWQTNPILVIASWVVALSGESGEKKFVSKRVHVYRAGQERARPIRDAEVIEPDYERLN